MNLSQGMYVDHRISKKAIYTLYSYNPNLYDARTQAAWFNPEVATRESRYFAIGN